LTRSTNIFSFGKNKARMVVENFEKIKAFAEEE
jgi:hypothetical protein